MKLNTNKKTIIGVIFMVLLLVAVSYAIFHYQKLQKETEQRNSYLQQQLVNMERQMADSRLENELPEKQVKQNNSYSISASNAKNPSCLYETYEKRIDFEGNEIVYRQPREVTISLENPSKVPVHLFSGVWTGIGNGSGIEFLNTNNENIKLFRVTDGDMCFYSNEYYYFNKDTHKAISVHVHSGCNKTLVDIEDYLNNEWEPKKNKYTMKLNIENSCRKEEGGVVSCRENGEQTVDQVIIENYSSLSIPEINFDCGGYGGVEGTCFPQPPRIVHEGVNKNLDVLYFSISNAEKIVNFSFDVNKRKLFNTTSDEIITITE